MLINREQQRVIDEVEQNILLLASAGTGKNEYTCLSSGSPHRGRLCEGGEYLVHDLYEQGGKRDERPHSIARRQSCKGCGG